MRAAATPEGSAISTHEDFRREEQIEGSSNRVFGLVIATVLAIVALWPLTNGAVPNAWFGIPAIGLALIALARPAWLAPFNVVWTRFGLMLNKVTNPVVMAAMFYGVITPAGLVMRVLGRNPMRRRFDRAAGSYWVERNPPGPSADSMKNQY